MAAPASAARVPASRRSILILFSDTGGGHRAAAAALDAAIHQLDPEAAITWCDPLIGQGRTIARRVSSLYPTIIKRSPPTWGAIFHASNTTASFAAVRAALRTQLRAVLERQLADTDPDLVVSVHPLLNHVTAGLLRGCPRPRGLFTVVTDLVDVHRGWACRDADLVAVATPQARQAMLRLGMPAARLRLLGMPVDVRFRPPAPGEREVIRRRLGLDEHRPTVLVSGGGEGSGGLLSRVRTLSEVPHPWQVIAVCGRNQALRRRLLGLPFATPTLVLGFVDDMPDLMRASDVVVGKAGPGAIAEGLATELPLVLTSYLPGQEHGNVRFVVESGAGRYAPRPRRLLAAVEELLAYDDHERRRMVQHAAAHRHAATEIARACLDLAARYRATSQLSR